MEYSQSELLMLVNNEMISFEKNIRSRDWRELIACAIVVAVFTFYFFFFSSPWIKIGSLVTVSSCLFIGYRLLMARPSPSNGQLSCNHSISQHLQLELKTVKTQKKLLTNVA